MKIVYNTILFTLLFLATSCDHSEKIDDIKLEISQNIFRNIDNNGGKITVAITSNSEWIIANSADWCIPDKYQGEGNDILTIKILANTKHANRQSIIFFINFSIVFHNKLFIINFYHHRIANHITIKTTEITKQQQSV